MTKTQQAPSIVDLDSMQGMDELLNEDKCATIEEGSIVNGTIVYKTDQGVTVDYNFKSEGFVPKDEFPNWSSLEVGDTIRAVLEELEDDAGGMPLLSVEKAILQEAWSKFTSEQVEGGVIKGLVKRRVKGGLMV
ncbi:MAG: S1 RNA-binding domain-containing protein, partial [Lentisphaeria bacterium]|nr:S1 RNA-binding domain-containing protein [Lentisphaeria bacterium]